VNRVDRRRDLTRQGNLRHIVVLLQLLDHRRPDDGRPHEPARITPGERHLCRLHSIRPRQRRILRRRRQ
jgi:hypothetical protein